MNYKTLLTIILAGLVIFPLALPSHGALNLEGQSGVFLNALAYPTGPGKAEVSHHHVDLGDLGTVSTSNVSTGLNNNIELGFTRVTSSVTGVKDQNIVLSKWQFAKETKTAPGLAAWVNLRSLSGGGSSADFGLSATRFIAGKRPVVLDFGVRSTKALGLGLFGFGSERELKLEGSVAVFVTKKLALATEFKQQIGARTWKDIAFRYVLSDNLNIDGGIANLGPGISSQLALGVTWRR